MGPRLISRGVYTTGVASFDAMRLQWGRGSLAAACCYTVVCAQVKGVLQWGRGSLAAACLPSVAAAIRFIVLQWGRGSLAAACLKFDPVREGQELPSMGPRLISRGVLRALDSLGWHRGLQWGRGSLAAACRWTHLHGGLANPSMGPRLISRGVSGCITNGAIGKTFNGAAAH